MQKRLCRWQLDQLKTLCRRVAVVHGLGDHVHHVPVHAAGQPEQREPASTAARLGSSEVTNFTCSQVQDERMALDSDAQMHFRH